MKEEEFDRNRRPFLGTRAWSRKPAFTSDLDSGSRAPNAREHPGGSTMYDSGMVAPCLTPASTVKKPEPVAARWEKDAWK